MARNIDWEAIEREYRANQLSVSEIARQYGISHTAINKRAKAETWTRDLAKTVRQTVRAKLVSDEVSEANARETIEIAALRGVQVVRSHQRALSQLNAIGDILATRLAQHLDGIKPDGPGLGDKESPSDMLEKLSRTRQRAIQLERQAFNLDGGRDDDDDASVQQASDRELAKAILAKLRKAQESTAE